MAARRMLRAFFRSIAWNTGALACLGALLEVVDAVAGDGSLFELPLTALGGAVSGVVAGVAHGVAQAAVALVREPHRRTVASALAAGVSASLVTWIVRAGDGDPVTVTALLTYFVPYVVASPFLVRWCHPEGGRR